MIFKKENRLSSADLWRYEDKIVNADYHIVLYYILKAYSQHFFLRFVVTVKRIPT